MVIEKLRKEGFLTDEEFDGIYPVHIQSLSSRHWTPLPVAKIAAHFLAKEEGNHILDLGCGVGKFCLAAAILEPNCLFYGIDFRANFIKLADKLKRRYEIQNVLFSCKDILQTSLHVYQGFYFFNSFQERIDDSSIIDEQTELSNDLYKVYTKYLYQQFLTMPIGTRIATYHTSSFCIPPHFKLVESHFYDQLKLYIREVEATYDASPLPDSIINRHISIYGP